MASHSYIGAKVKLLREVRTKGGTVFKKGVVMRCHDSTSGGLSLSVQKRGWTQYITHVSKLDVIVVEWPQKKED